MDPKQTLVYADDNLNVLNVVGGLLQHYNVITANSAAEAIYRLRTSNAQFLIANTRLQGVGMLLDIASMDCPGTEVIVVSGNDRDREWARLRGVKVISERLIANEVSGESVPVARFKRSRRKPYPAANMTEALSHA